MSKLASSSEGSIKLPSIIYVDIQALFDTRLACLNILSPELALDLVSTDEYFLRQTDDFKKQNYFLEAADLKKMRFSGNYEIIKNSMLTALPLFLMELVHRYIEMSVSTPFVKGVSISINMYPYTLTQEEQNEIARLLKQSYQIAVPVQWLNMSPKELLPSFLLEHCLALIFYDYIDWANFHHLSIQKKPIKALPLYVPKLMLRQTTREEDIEFEKHGSDVFKFAQMLFEHLLPFQYLSVDYYCASLPTNPRSHWAKPVKV